MQRADAIVTASLRTIPARVAASLARRRAALYTQHGRHWRRMSGPDLLRHVEAAADGLQRLGLRHGECLAIVCRTRAEWLIAELAAMTRDVVEILQEIAATDIARIARRGRRVRRRLAS